MQESGEMYLETILVIGKQKNIVRSVDIAEYMNFSKPSVSRAMSKLKEENYIVMDSDGFIALTEKGRNVAEKIYTRHTVLTNVLSALGVPRDIAEADACKIEHDISDETFMAIQQHIARYGVHENS